jgi:hypothetical protein
MATLARSWVYLAAACLPAIRLVCGRILDPHTFTAVEYAKIAQ